MGRMTETLDQIAGAGPAPVPAAGPTAGGAFLQIVADLGVSIGRVAEVMQAQADHERRCQQAIRRIDIPPKQVQVAGGNAVIADADLLGPKTGYNWAVSRLSVGGLAAGDSVSFYKGPAIAQTVQPNNLLFTVTLASPTWHPGRTALILDKGDTIVAAGSGLTATAITITGETILLESWLLPKFLM